MRIVLQRVKKASVFVDENMVSNINSGILIFLGVEVNDTIDDVLWISNKVIQLRIFQDENRVMNKSILDVKGEILVVSQFTLHARTKKGTRPSYIRAAKPKKAIPLYNSFIKELSFLLENDVKKGEFGADMNVSLVNDGPVTIIIDSKNKE